MKLTKLLLLGTLVFPAALLLTDAVRSEGDGIMSGEVINGTTVPKDLAKGGRSCGTAGCHTPGFPTGQGVDITVNNRVLDLSGKATVTVLARGRNATFGKVTNAGFNAQIDKGKFVAGVNNQLTTYNMLAQEITHQNNRSVAWTFTYMAPATTAGVTQLWAVVNDVNGNGTRNGDSWAFHNSNPGDGFSTPVRLYTNAKGVTSYGMPSCPDGNGNYAVLGSPTVPTIGNKNFRLEAWGTPPGQAVFFLLGINSQFVPIDLKNINAPGCFQNADIFISFLSTTTGTNDLIGRRTASGTWSAVFPINLPAAFKGAKVIAQLAIADQDSKNGPKLVTTNGAMVTFQ